MQRAAVSVGVLFVMLTASARSIKAVCKANGGGHDRWLQGLLVRTSPLLPSFPFFTALPFPFVPPSSPHSRKQATTERSNAMSYDMPSWRSSLYLP